MAVSTIDPNGLNIGQIGGRRNLIQNGSVAISQRGISFNPPATGAYVVDRFHQYQGGGGVLYYEQSTDAPAGFKNSLKVTVNTADTSIASSDFYFMRQTIEGLNCTPLSLGTSDAVTFTLSFYVKSSLTGTFNGCFQNGPADRSYVYEYTINAANTWERKTVTLVGDTTGTWFSDNRSGLRVTFDFGMGSNFNTTANSWQAGSYFCTSSAVKLVGTASATWQITGVQLEVGEATPFEHEDYGTTLQKCQRYYWRQTRTNNGNTINAYIGIGQGVGTTEVVSFVRHPVQMRDSPTFSASGSSHIAAHGSSNLTQTGYLGGNLGIDTVAISATGSGGVNGGCYRVFIFGDGNYFQLDAEL